MFSSATQNLSLVTLNLFQGLRLFLVQASRWMLKPTFAKASAGRRVRHDSALAAVCVLIFIMPLCAHAFGGGTPIATDSRIKTFVYNENDVYRLLTHYGYQLNVEFGNKEEIETISVGDRTGWQIIPAGQRLFIRAMEDKAHTNMTVVTNRHAYQFDLYSAPPGQQGWDELVYVVRFYYPGDQNIGGGMPAMAPMPASMPMPAMNNAYPMQQPQQPMMQAAPAYSPQQPMMSAAPSNSNFGYSFTGEQAIVPSQMYDDGRQTYLVFSSSQMVPQVSMVANGREQSVATNTQGSTVMVQGVYPQLVLRFGNSQACIFNETMQRQ